MVYVGRAFAGWPASRYGNPFRPRPGFDAVAAYRDWLHGRVRLTYNPPPTEADLADLWEQTGHGAKPLGCWCVTVTAGDGSPAVCHAQVLAELLRERFAVNTGGTT